MYLRIKLPRGTLKIKHERDLRHPERDGRVPVWRLGNHRIVWWPAPKKQRPDESDPEAQLH
jgi:hypothetical protein